MGGIESLVLLLRGSIFECTEVEGRELNFSAQEGTNV